MCTRWCFFPDELRKELPLGRHPRLRISAEVCDVPVEGAWQPAMAPWYLMLSKELLQTAGVGVGARAEVRFRVVDQDEVEVPRELGREGGMGGTYAGKTARARLQRKLGAHGGNKGPAS